MRRLLVPLLGALFLVSLLPTPVQALPAVPYCAGSVSPVAPSAGAPATIMPEACEQATSRVFPESIFLPEYAAAGNTGYATDFVSFFEAQAGLEYLNATYPDWIEIHTVAESYGWPATPGGELVHSPVYVVEVTNEQSPVPLDQRLELLFMLSIHGVEKGGREGGLRVIEDFVKNIGVAAETVQNGAGMPTPLGKPTGGKVTTYRDYLDFTRMFFLFPNPDGWTHDELPYVASGGVCGGNGALMCRANGNGTDLNRQTPTIGWQLINEGAGRLPVNEPEAVGYLNWLVEGHEWNYAIDIHGMLNHQNFLAIMMPAGSASSQEMLRSTRLAETLKERVNLDPHFAQWTTLLAVSAQVGDAECEQGPPAPCSIPLPVLGPTRIRDVGSEEFADWSTVWDAIGYTDSGTSGDFFAQQNGLNAPGYDIEMAYNHLVADSAYPGIGAFWNDYHIHSVRHIVKSFLDAAALDVKVSLETNGHRTAYVKPTFVATSLDDESLTPGGWADANPNDDHFQYSAEAPIMATPGKYWTDLQPFLRDGEAPGVLTALDASRVSGSTLDGYDTLVIPGSAIRDLEAEEGAVDAVLAWTRDGGNLVLTDEAVRFFDLSGRTEGAVDMDLGYAGAINLVRDHEMNAGVLGEARQTYEPVPLGYSIQSFSSPIWTVSASAFGDLGGEVAGTGYVGTDVSLGRVAVGSGKLQFIGALLPDPSEEFYHPYGLDDYATTYSGNQILRNMLNWTEVFEAPPIIISGDGEILQSDNEPGAQQEGPGDESASDEDTPFVPVVLLLAGLGAAALVRRRRSA